MIFGVNWDFVQYFREERNSKRKVLSCIFLVLFVLDFFVFSPTPSSWMHKKSQICLKITLESTRSTAFRYLDFERIVSYVPEKFTQLAIPF